jgi:ADP-ribose pyrophosphatase YjhB (NUDIX family)
MHPKEFYQHCPKCGSADFRAESGNSLHCEACAFTWYYNSAAAADVILANAAGEILMTTRARAPAPGSLDFPGGFVNEGESAEEAACRETKEETGVELEPHQLQYMASFPNEYQFGGVTYFALDLVYTASVDAALVEGVADDVSGARFVSPDSIDPQDIGLESTRRAFLHYRARPKT